MPDLEDRYFSILIVDKIDDSIFPVALGIDHGIQRDFPNLGTEGSPLEIEFCQ
jgi:hypothetical protein